MLLAEDRTHALALLGAHHPELVLADINGETLGLLDAIRTAEGLAGRVDRDTPMIVLTNRAGKLGELARTRVFEHDGDDVVSKPFSYPELRGRIRALLRRAYRQQRSLVRIGTLGIDLAGREAYVADRPVTLAAKEFELLRALASDPTRVFTKQELLRDVWGYQCQSRTRTLDSHACRLRRKLMDAGADRRLIVNVWGVGLRLCDQVGA